MKPDIERAKKARASKSNAMGRLVNTLEDAGDELAPCADPVADYVFRNTSDIVLENATTIAARLKGVGQRAKGRRD